jgi:hypothetical protein
MLNIITTNEKAANSPSRGAAADRSAFRAFLPATIQIGVIAANAAADVAGLRYPSGMCMTFLCLHCTSWNAAGGWMSFTQGNAPRKTLGAGRQRVMQLKDLDPVNVGIARRAASANAGLTGSRRPCY